MQIGGLQMCVNMCKCVYMCETQTVCPEYQKVQSLFLRFMEDDGLKVFQITRQMKKKLYVS